MIDQIDRLTEQQEGAIEAALLAAIVAALAAFDSNLVENVLINADDDGVDDHATEQLAMVLGIHDGTHDALAAAIDDSKLADTAGSFFAAVAALAVAALGRVLAANDTSITAARASAVASMRATFIHESAIAMRETAARMVSATAGDPISRAAQLKRVIGLSSLQARSLHALRNALNAYTSDPRRADPKTILAAARGNLSAAQTRMLTKALRDQINAKQAEALLDRHAKALRNARVKAFSGNAAHQLAETAKLTGWQIAQRFGALSPDQRRFWQTAGDERVRHAHAQVPGMNAQGVALNHPFATPLGPCLTPPLETGCRCKAVLRRAA